jgi:hypothetical protein
MAKQRQRQRQRQQRRRRQAQPVNEFMVHLVALAVESLGFDERQVAAAETDDKSEEVDILQARVLEFLEEMAPQGGPWQSDRAELVRRRGSEFVERVRAMGKSAAAALAGIVVALLVWLLPSSAAAVPAPGAHPFSSHNVSRLRRRLSALRNLARRRRVYHGGGGRGWIQTRGSFAPSWRPSTSSQSSATGCERGRGSSVGRARVSRSYSSGGVESFTPATFRTAPRTLRSSAKTGASSARPGSTTNAHRVAP